MNSKQRRKNLLLYLNNLKQFNGNKSYFTTYIHENAEIYGIPIYYNSLELCRNDLTKLEKEGHINRIQYLLGPIEWVIL